MLQDDPTEISPIEEQKDGSASTTNTPSRLPAAQLPPIRCIAILDGERIAFGTANKICLFN